MMCEVLTAVTTKNSAYSDGIPCSLVACYESYAVTCCLRVQLLPSLRLFHSKFDKTWCYRDIILAEQSVPRNGWFKTRYELLLKVTPQIKFTMLAQSLYHS